MYKVSIKVDNKSLGDVLEQLDNMRGLIGSPDVQNMRNAIVKDGQVVAKSGSMTAASFIVFAIAKEKLKTVSTETIRTLLEGAGFKPSGAGSCVRYLMRNKIIGPVIKGRPGVHEVLRPAKEA